MILGLGLLLVSSTTFAAAPIVCQMAAIKAAVDAYDARWGDKSRLSSVKSISFEKSKPGVTVLFQGNRASLKPQACTARVTLKMIGGDTLGCPEYEFSEFADNCGN
jgi:hypothetical protein